MGSSVAKELVRPEAELIADYRNVSLSLLTEAFEIFADVQRCKERLDVAEFDECFGLFLGDAELHFNIFQGDDGLVDPYEVLCAACLILDADLQHKIRFLLLLFRSAGCSGVTRVQAGVMMTVTCRGLELVVAKQQPDAAVLDRVLARLAIHFRTTTIVF